MSWSLVAEQTIQGGQKILLPNAITSAVLVIESIADSTDTKETVPGYVRAIATFARDTAPFSSVDFDRVSISLVHPQLFEVTQTIVVSYQLELVLYDFITFPVVVKVWAVEGVTLPLDGAVNGDSSSQLLELIPLPSSTGISIGPGRAIFEAGTVTKEWTDERSVYTLSSVVSASEFWRIGFRSVQKFSRGRLRFGSGVGPSVLGLAPQFNNVDFSLTQWGVYVASASEVRVFEFRDGAIANVAQFPWTPSRDLGIRIEGDQVYYEMLIDNDWQVVFTSNHTFTEECHFIGTLGPQAFVFNVQYEAI